MWSWYAVERYIYIYMYSIYEREMVLKMLLHVWYFGQYCIKAPYKYLAEQAQLKIYFLASSVLSAVSHIQYLWADRVCSFSMILRHLHWLKSLFTRVRMKYWGPRPIDNLSLLWTGQLCIWCVVFCWCLTGLAVHLCTWWRCCEELQLLTPKRSKQPAKLQQMTYVYTHWLAITSDFRKLGSS